MFQPSGLESHRERPTPQQIEYGDPRLREFTAPPPIAPPPPSHVQPSGVERTIMVFYKGKKLRKKRVFSTLGSLITVCILLGVYFGRFNACQRANFSDNWRRREKHAKSKSKRKGAKPNLWDVDRGCFNQTETFEGSVEN